MIPVLSGVFSVVVFNESFGALKIFGGALVLIGVALARRSRPTPVRLITPKAQKQASLQSPQ
jgi:drug/metabolite transporter (DMT)-like permease